MSGRRDLITKIQVIKKTFIETVNKLASAGAPFFFIVDFEKEQPFVCEIGQALDHGYKFRVRGHHNYINGHSNASIPRIDVDMNPISIEEYAHSFHHVKENLRQGNSYLVNLTFPTPLQTNLSLSDIFDLSAAPYKLLKENEFVIFSPESFIQIKDDHIYSYPMKGTIDADLPDARKKILNNDKETWEHNTIVDLIRNDLAMVSNQVEVTKFKYLDLITTHRNRLYQMSSEIRGTLSADWRENLGEIIMKLLPAGSISGAPKKKTIQIIQDAEKIRRNFYTGVFGIFDGEKLDSAVNIRYVEKTNQGLQYRSGGGITAMSNQMSEYQEMLDKVYVPTI